MNESGPHRGKSHQKATKPKKPAISTKKTAAKPKKLSIGSAKQKATKPNRLLQSCPTAQPRRRL